jgi:hypothetical protein
LISYSIWQGAAKRFSYGSQEQVEIEKPIYVEDVFCFVPSCLDDMAWIDAKTIEDYWFNRRELNFFEREGEVIFYDDDFYRTFFIDECYHLTYQGDRFNPQKLRMK